MLRTLAPALSPPKSAILLALYFLSSLCKRKSRKRYIIIRQQRGGLEEREKEKSRREERKVVISRAVQLCETHSLTPSSSSCRETILSLSLFLSVSTRIISSL